MTLARRFKVSVFMSRRTRNWRIRGVGETAKNVKNSVIFVGLSLFGVRDVDRHRPEFFLLVYRDFTGACLALRAIFFSDIFRLSTVILISLIRVLVS